MAAQIDSLLDENPPPIGLTEEQLDDYIMGVILAQHFSLRKGISLFGEKIRASYNGRTSSYSQHGYLRTPRRSRLTRDEKRDALESLLFITEKRDGRIKSRK